MFPVNDASAAAVSSASESAGGRSASGEYSAVGSSTGGSSTGWIEIDRDETIAPAAYPPRGARTPRLIGLDGDPDATCRAAEVAVVGNGSVGRPLALHLARLGIGRLWLVDPGRYKPESLLTQPVQPGDVDRAKAPNTAALCKQIGPETCVRAYTGRFEDLGVFDLANADVVVLATDNLAAEVAVGRRCLQLGLRLVQASVHGATLVAQVRRYSNQDATGACPACGFGAVEWQQLGEGTRFSCDGGRPALQTTAAPPTASFSSLCSLAADLAALEVVRLLLGIGAEDGDVLIEYCGFKHAMVTSPLRRNPQCPCEHVVWQPREVAGDWQGVTLRQLAAAAGIDLAAGHRGAALTLDGSEFVEAGVCCGCGDRQEIGEFLAPHPPADAIPPRCRRCGGELVRVPLTTHRRTPFARLDYHVDVPLRSLTEPLPRWVVVHDGERAVRFHAAARETEGVPS